MEINSKKVAIIDFKLGNLFSVKQACDMVGINSKITSDKGEVSKADALILPGVGAFNKAMSNLKELGLDKIIIEKVSNGTPIFGICLGLQLLFSQSEEFDIGEGLNLIPGTIKQFPKKIENKKIKVPHISWNRIYKFKLNWNKTPLNKLESSEFMYFIHSYYVKPDEDFSILTMTNYEGIEFCSSIYYKNIFATQFHPEKSADKGISIYKEWAKKNNLIK